MRGPAALRVNQMRSGLACAVGGSLLTLLLLAALLVYLEGEGLFAFLMVLLIILSCVPRIKNTRRIYKVYNDVLKSQQEEEQGDDPNYVTEVEGISHSFEMYRVTRPTPGLCWFMFGLEMAFFFVWPLVSLIVIKNLPVVLLFVVVSIISMIRYYLNAAILIKEIGTFETIGQGEKDDEKRWKVKSRLCSILLHITRGPTRRVWMWIFVILAFGIIVFSVASLGTSTEDAASSSEDVVILPRGDFVYKPQPADLQYPTCRLAKGLEIPNSNSTGLADYAFLAAMAYQRPEVFQDRLDAWFGPGIATDRPDIVREFRSVVEGGQAAVSYRFVTFPGSLGVIVVRGSTTAWEWLTDAQLWSGAALVGLYRWLLPVGSIFTPILAQTLSAISWVQSDRYVRENTWFSVCSIVY